MEKINSTEIIPTEIIMNKILVIRNKKVMIDSDLADLYGVSTKRLNEQVKRNRGRFPEDFMFTCSFKHLVLTPYKSARSLSIITFLSLITSILLIIISVGIISDELIFSINEWYLMIIKIKMALIMINPVL